MPFRDRLPAFVLVGLLHILAVLAFLHAIIIEPEEPNPERQERETQITLLRAAPALAPEKRRRRKPARSTAGGTTAITPYFNPYAYHAPPVLQNGANHLALALSSCDAGNYDMASVEVRTMCDRIGALLKNDPGHFGVASDVVDARNWQRELARREAPYLAPCMTPNGPDLLYALTCVYKVLFGGYDSENRPRYSQ